MRNVEVCLDFRISDVSLFYSPKRLFFVQELVFRLNPNRAGVSHKPSPAGTVHLCSDIARTPLTSSHERVNDKEAVNKRLDATTSGTIIEENLR